MSNSHEAISKCEFEMRVKKIGSGTPCGRHLGRRGESLDRRNGFFIPCCGRGHAKDSMAHSCASTTIFSRPHGYRIYAHAFRTWFVVPVSIANLNIPTAYMFQFLTCSSVLLEAQTPTIDFLPQPLGAARKAPVDWTLTPSLAGTTASAGYQARL